MTRSRSTTTRSTTTRSTTPPKRRIRRFLLGMIVIVGVLLIAWVLGVLALASGMADVPRNVLGAGVAIATGLALALATRRRRS